MVKFYLMQFQQKILKIEEFHFWFFLTKITKTKIYFYIFRNKILTSIFELARRRNVKIFFCPQNKADKHIA
jgi:hypothetical protein